MSDAQIEQILRIKEAFGDRLIIPAHHYQKPEIVALSDIIGDSYRLAVDVSRTDADYIVFCGVKFMAEGAAVLANEDQKVLLPRTDAICPMAEMIDSDRAEKAFAILSAVSDRPVVPIVYMNAHADMKAFCGKYGGAVCTSSNAQKVLTHYFDRGYSVFFFPDQHLGINTAKAMDLDEGDVRRLRRDYSLVPVYEGDTSDDQALIYVWDGFCPVHQQFGTDQIESLRASYPGIHIVVHPEVEKAVAEAADSTGSTGQIYNRVIESPAGSVWGIGTELHFVQRLATEVADRGVTVYPLADRICKNMDKTDLGSLLAALQEAQAIEAGKSSSDLIVTVPAEVRELAAAALNKMIAIVEGA